LKDKEKPGGGFTPQTNTSTANNEATLGFVGTSAVSSDDGVVGVEIIEGKLVLTPVSEGSATITVSADGYTDATVEVTVGADGTVTVDEIRPGVSTGGNDDDDSGDGGNDSGGFTPQTNNSTANDVATLGLVGESVSSSDTGVATVEFKDDKIAITSVAAGTATITVSADGYTDATIEVTVGADGVAAVGAITPGVFLSVTGITGIPIHGMAGIDITLNGTVVPANAANKTIVWSVKNAGGTGAGITGNILSTTGEGTLVLTATIANGTATGTDFTRDFNITIGIFTTLAQYREMAQATSTDVTITGDSAYYYAPGASYYKGVFVENREVTLRPFKIAKQETTYELWYEVKQWADGNGYTFANPGRQGGDYRNGTGPVGTNRHPVTEISWRDAVVWCNAYSEMSGKEPVYYTDDTYTTVLRVSTNDDGTATTADLAKMKPGANGYRLPTEAEWEYAARGGGMPSATGTFADKWAGTNTETDLVNYAWYNGSATHPVGGKTESGLGLYDMSGNVWEWCWDWHEYRLAASLVTDPVGPVSGENRVLRGGGWNSSVDRCAVSYRDIYGPSTRCHNLGFRLVCP
jgi:formylglycine-generating enzyme required for sulfatase activity